MSEKKATREGYADAILELGQSRPEVVVLEADLGKSTGSIKFKERFPERFFDIGVAEQNMVGTAAGLAASGKICYTGSFAVFAAGRAFEQVRNTVAYGRLNVKLCPSHGGVSVGEDGASHQCSEDVALMRVIPNMIVIVPSDYWEARAAAIAAADIDGPVYIRMGRPALPMIHDKDYVFEVGKAEKLRDGPAATIAANGLLVSASLEAADQLAEEGISVDVLNVHTVKPLDEEAILESVRKTGRIVTAEEAFIAGGLGSAVAELLTAKHPVLQTRIGVRDEFGRSGGVKDLLTHFGLTAEDVAAAVRRLL